MLNKLILIATILLVFANVTKGWFENCNYSYNIDTSSILVIKSSGYPYNYASGSSCKWYLQAPVGYTIELKCSYNLDDPSSDCSSQRLYVSRDGDKELNYADFFCYYSTFTKMSVGNEISLGYTSNTGKSGVFYCEAKAVKTTQANCQCGWSKTGRIVGGSFAQPNEFVSMAALVDIAQRDSEIGPIFSGAALISEYYALTAAHCFNDKSNISNIHLLVGDHDINSVTDTPYALLYQALRVIKHEDFDPLTSEHDIALIQTRNPIRWKRTIGPACLPFIYNGYDDYFDDYSLVAAGYGATEFAGPSSTVLKKVSLTVIPNSECSSFYDDITPENICTYTKGADTCQRDSGSSLYWSYNNRQYTIGIVSYGTACASNSPSVNTRVTRYLDWIEKQLPGILLCEK